MAKPVYGEAAPETAQDPAGLVAELRDLTRKIRKVFPPKRLENPEEHCVRLMCGAVDRAADALEAMGRDLAEKEAHLAEAWNIIEKERATVDMLNSDAGAWHRRAETAERLLSESQAEGRRKDEALEPFAKVLKGNWSKQSDDAPIVVGMNQYDLRLNLKLGDFRRARIALAARDEGDGR